MDALSTGMGDILIVAGLGVTALLAYWAWDHIDWRDGLRTRGRGGRRLRNSPSDLVDRMTSRPDEPYDGRPF